MIIQISNLKSQNYSKGAALYLAVAIMAILLSIALGVSSILLSQIKVIRSIGYSVIAFYAADAGIENVLLQRANPASISETILSNGATYQVVVNLPGGSCTAANYCIKSIGKYRETRRAIEINY